MVKLRIFFGVVGVGLLMLVAALLYRIERQIIVQDSAMFATSSGMERLPSSNWKKPASSWRTTSAPAK